MFDFSIGLMTRGFAVLSLEGEGKKEVDSLFTASRDFFANTQKYKYDYIGDEEKTESNRYELFLFLSGIEQLCRRHNHGYIKIEDVREYIKLRVADPAEFYPNTPQNFKQCFE